MHRFNDLADFSTEEIGSLLELAQRLEQHPEPHALEGKILSLLFLSPSLREQMRAKGLDRAKHFSWDAYRTALWRAFNGESSPVLEQN